MIQELLPAQIGPPDGGSGPGERPSHIKRKSADQEIVTLYAQSRWDEACSLLYQIYYPTILKIVTRRLRGWYHHGGLKEQAEDVAMEALHRVHASLKRQAEDGQIHQIQLLRAWILRTVSWQCLTAIKKRKENKELLATDKESTLAETPANPFSELALIEEVDNHRRLQDFRACTLEIESRVGQALRLWLTGLTYAQVALRLGYRGVSSVHGAIQAATKKVQKCLIKKGWNPKRGGAQ